MYEAGINQKEYMAALDLGSFELCLMAAHKNEQGVLSILACEKEPTKDCIRRGCIYNIEETANKISILINRLNKRLNPAIKKVYVGIGGQSLRAEWYTVKKEIGGKEINYETINHLYNECLKYKPEFAEVLDIVSPEYFVDGHPETNPEGLTGYLIEARFLLITGRATLKINIGKSIENNKTKIEIAGYFISPLAVAKAVLTNREKKLGCALVEIGAEVTYLSIYKNNSLKYLITIPLGGDAITKDICDMGVSEQEAEELKIKKGNACVNSDEEELLDTIIEARANEIVMNVIKQIEQSGYAAALQEGIIITGGSALLKNLDELFIRQKMKPVRIAFVDKSLIRWEDSASALIENPANVCVFGLLSLGKENCAKEFSPTVNSVTESAPVSVGKKPEKSVKQGETDKNILRQLQNKVKGFFDD
jgi:cell division protein FtsA